MIDFKEAYIAALEEELWELEYGGVPIREAYELASKRAYSRMAENVADAADTAKTLHKEGL